MQLFFLLLLFCVVVINTVNLLSLIYKFVSTSFYYLKVFYELQEQQMHAIY